MEGTTRVVTTKEDMDSPILTTITITIRGDIVITREETMAAVWEIAAKLVLLLFVAAAFAIC